MKCPTCKKKMKDKSYLLLDIGSSDGSSLRWVEKYKCKRCGTKVVDGNVKERKSNIEDEPSDQ